VVEEKGVRGLWHVVNLILLWSMATAAKEADTHDAVGTYAVRTKWGSRAKFYRELRYWRELTGTESPAVLMAYVSARPGRKGEAEVLGKMWSIPARLVVAS
jgi:hypothetical protein